MQLEKIKVKVEAAREAAAAMEAKAPVRNLKRRLEANKKTKEYTNYADIVRICNLAIVPNLTEEETEEYNKTSLLAKAYDSGFRFFSSQANGAYAYEVYGGMFGPIGVGEGKTMLTLRIAGLAYAKGIKKIMLMVPPEVMGQLVETDIRFARHHIPMNYPIHIMGRPLKQRAAIARSGKSGLYIFPYSMLSTVDTDDNLEAIRPELIIGDEAHRIANATAARSRRIMAYIEEHLPECVFVSGTITQKSVMDYYHLIRPALRRNMPLPLSAALARAWGEIIDSEQVSWKDHPDGPDRESGPGPILPLVDWARRHYPEQQISDNIDGFRTAYRLRFESAPGVVVSGESSLGTSLIIANRPVENWTNSEGYQELKKLIEQVETRWLTPNGDEIEHPFHAWKWLNELSAGFYNELTWPDYETFAARRDISIDQATVIIEKAKEYHLAGNSYGSMLRSWIQEHARPRLDTPFLIGSDMHMHGSKNVGSELYDAWMEWKNKDFEGRPDRDSRAVRVCPFKMRAAVEWAGNIKGGAILWVHHIAVGEWLSELLHAAGQDVIYCPAGARGNESILSMANAGKKIVASITAHGTGKNLQHFQHMCVVQWPRPAKTAEQMLGRLHRNGQKADELEVRLMLTTDFDFVNFAACLNDALYIHQTGGGRQKLVYANYNPLPKIFPSAVLRQRGMEHVKMLNAEQTAYMQERFGK